MKFVAVLLLVTVLDLRLMCQALDDDEEQDRKYSVTFFQFNPKDLGILGGHTKEHIKRHIKRSEIEPLSKPTNNTARWSNVAPVRSLNESSVPTNSTNTLVRQISNNTGIGVNETRLIHNMSEYHTKDNNSTSPATSSATDINIMNALIDLAVQKKNSTATSNDVPSANKTDVRSINTTSNVSAQKTSTINNTANDMNKTMASGANSTKRNYVSPKRNEVLNPNPKPSEHEAMLNVKDPKQLEHKGHDSLIHSENTTNVVAAKDKHETTSNSVEMVKNKNADSDKGSEQNATEAVADTEKEKETEQKKKLLKDKQTNKEIKEGAKDITPVTDTVGDVSDIMKESAVKNAHARTSVNEVDDKVIKHRTSVAEFVPLYHTTTPKDHKLSFQVGSMKHPKHNIHPKCHACPLNSTYKECVKKSTLRQCNEGLNNICFTKSTKKKGTITYEMGCSDHNNCVHAKAFPCKDEKEHCFTCCQFDRCNSSPHQGDYELDELNLDELSDPVASASFKDSTILDSKSATEAISGTWMAYASTLFVLLILRL